MKKMITCALGAILLVSSAATAQTTICEDFEGGSNPGWTGPFGVIVPTYQVAGGNPTGHLNIVDNGNNPDWFSPASGIYSSDYRSQGVSKISVDMTEQSGPQFSVWLVLVNDPDPMVMFDESFAFVEATGGPLSPPAGGGWFTYDFDVPSTMMTSPAAWSYFGGGVGGTDDDKWNFYMTGGTTQIQIAVANNPILGFDLPGTPWDYGLDNVCYTLDIAGTDSCNGDGGNQMGCTNCPCGNNAIPGTIGGCLNSAGTSARLIVAGDTSVSLPSGASTDLRFSLSGAPANAFCILNSGDAVAPSNVLNPCFGQNSGSQATAFDGLRCAITNTRRHGGRSADAMGDVGTTNGPWGGEGNPAAGLANAGAGFTAGQTRYFQVINRDDVLLSCMRGLNTSQSIEITFTP